MDHLTTQPIRDRNAVWHHFGKTQTFPEGLILRHVNGNTYESIDLNGKHIQYWSATPIVYEPTLAGQALVTRAIKQ